MKSTFNKNDLLPEGFKVFLPEDAAKEEYISRKIQDYFFSNGYLLVKTPLIEYESNQIKGLIKYKPDNSFFLMEPDTKKILVLRSDITSQIVRLATSKLASYNRPLRLMYAGEVLRNEKNIYQSDRQFKQIGAEIIGSSSSNSLVEILNITLDTLKAMNVNNITIDFSLPSISRYLETKIDFKKKEGSIIKEALDNKDSSIIRNTKYKYVKDLIELSGTIDKVSKKVNNVKFPKTIDSLLKDFFKIALQVKKKIPNLSITFDITEAKSFLHYESLGFKIYNKENATAIAIGGDYKINKKENGLGITIMVNKLIENIKLKKVEKIYIPYNIDIKKVPEAIKKKYILVKELFPKKHALTEAIKHKCAYIFKKDMKLNKVEEL